MRTIVQTIPSNTLKQKEVIFEVDKKETQPYDYVYKQHVKQY